MFILEESIKAWKSKLRRNPAFEDGDIAELESHLRDEIDRLKSKGLSQEEAFAKASKEIGEPESLGLELYKTRAIKVDAAPSWKQSPWIPYLLPNYLKLAFRRFKRHRGYTFINVLGLAVGLACCLLIYLYVQLEVSYDQFHSRSDRIYRVVTDINQAGQTRKLAWSSPPLANALISDFPEVQQAVRIHRPGGTMRSDEESQVVEVSFVDSTFFEVFDFKLRQGDPKTALSEPGSIVLTQEQADRFFKDKDPMHSTLTFADTLQFEVTGILADIPPNSHFHPQFLANLQTLSPQRFQQWGGMNLWTYIVLNKKTSGKDLESKLPEFIEAHLGKTWASLMTLHLQPLTSIYFNSHRLPEIGPTGDLSYVYIFSAIGIFVLLIACINFMNLSTAQSLQRAREVGVRKVLGVSRGQLIRQFLGESLLLAFLAMILALTVAQLALPVFGELSGYELSGMMFFNPSIITGLLGTVIIIGILSGLYPAFILSAFKPSEVLSGNISLGSSHLNIKSSNNLLRRGLIILQFSISIVLLIGTGVISNQLNYIQNKDLGFNKDQIMVVRLNEDLRNNYDAFKQKLTQNSEIQGVGASSQVPGIPIALQGYRPEGMTEGNLLTNTIFIDEDYLNTMEIKLIAGRGFSSNRPTDLEKGFLLNKAAVSHFGWTDAKEAIGKTIRAVGEHGIDGKVIGIVENFNYESLYNQVKPLVLRYRNFENMLSIRMTGEHIRQTRDYIEGQWNILRPNEPFVSWFLDEQLQTLYDSATRMSTLFRYFSGIAIFIACLGLFGLASFTIQRRTKEIGIRKVLGASLNRLLILLSKEYTLLVVLANIVAWPLAYLVMSNWLGDFAYRVSLKPWIFFGTGSLVVLIALVTVGFHSLRVARMNPVKSLKNE
ncbi:MAG: ABC transporter permease [Balneolaceae bacterium]|jgi:putative ABC transport system permease protein